MELRAPLSLRGERDYAQALPLSVGKPSAGGGSGVDGDSPFIDISGGGIDLNPELSGFRKFLIYEEMRKSDPAVKSALFMYKLPARTADWALDAAGDGKDPMDRIIHDCTAWQFGLEGQDGQLDLTWDEWLQQSMLFFDFGAMGEEVIDGEVQIWKPTGDDGTNSRIVKPFARFAPRFPGTFAQIETDHALGTIKRARQNLPGADWIPGDRLAWYSPDREGTNWMGTSLLRAMYGPWRLKKALMIAAGIGWDRYASGVPVVRYPQGGGARDKGTAEKIARNYRTHERAWVTFEGTKEQGWDLEIVGGTQTLGDPTPLLHLYDEQIAAAALQQFSKLGTTVSGSRAVGEVLVDPFYQAVESYASFLRARRQREAIRRFVDVNFGEEFEAPKLRVGKIQSRNVWQLAQAIEMLSSAGLSFVDRETQNDLRDLMDLRHLPAEVQETIDALPDDIGLEGTGLPVAA